MTQTQPDLLLKKKKKFVTQPNPSSPKNQPNPAGGLGRVGLGLAGFLHTPTNKDIFLD